MMQAPAVKGRTNKRTARLAQLIRIYQTGQVSELMDQTLDKLFSVEAAEAQKDVEELRADLLKFEERFDMTSEEFYNRFEAGEMGDDADFIEWASFFDMYHHAKDRLAALSDEA
ncbi:hypothetical protein [Promineifilum sp.]|uniref:hypothetical protein n=1 Tax=Promineifilum sp. TaxID=2664178 RepID=UPI0035B10576